MKSQSANHYPIRRGTKVPKPDTKTQSKVTVNIQPGPISPAQKTAWRKFWQKLIVEVGTKDSFQSQNNYRKEPGR